MDTQKLTYGGMLSALIVAMTVCVTLTGVGYTLFLDIGLPIMIGLIYFKCEFKYTSICAFISLAIIFFGLGQFATAIWMFQGMMIGLICGQSIDRPSTIMDDFLNCAVSSSFIIIFIDIYCEKILGMSLMKELWQTVNTFPV